MKLKFKRVTMPTEEIKITSAFSRSMPRLCKLKTCMDFYRANGYFDRQIIIDSDKYLLDGYCAYLTAKLLDVQTVRALMVSGVAEQDKPVTDSKPSARRDTKPQERFRPGMLVKITGNTNGHRFSIGETVRLVEQSYAAEWAAEDLDGYDWWCVTECDMEPIESVKDKSEPTKLYCIKDYDEWLTEGKTYEFDGGIVSYDDGRRSFIKYKSLDEWKRCNPTPSACLVPLVKRLAKVGEWIYVTTNNGGCVKAGTIWKVANVDAERIYLTNDYVCSRNNYLVLDGYTDEKE